MKLPTRRGDLHVVDDPGVGPAIVLMHGFPDDSRIYDRLRPVLSGRRVVTFDFLGYGYSDRFETDDSGAFDPGQDLVDVVDSLGPEAVILVGHDASGPVAIDYALQESGRVSHLVLVNTYYGNVPELRFPEMIRLFADEHFAPLADAMVADTHQLLWLLQHTARQFGYVETPPDGIAFTSVVPQFFGGDIPDALAAIRRWTGTLYKALAEQDRQIASHRLARLDLPVTLIFGVGDSYLSPELAHQLGGLFARAEVHIVENASHWPQWDQAQVVGDRLLALQSR